MKKVFKRVLLAATVMVVSLTAGIFASCSYGADPEETKKNQGYSCCVTYDANGGTFGSNSTRTYALVKENSLTPAPGYVDGKTQGSVKVPTRRNYQLVGEAKDDNDDDKNEEAILSKSWFLAQTDENGNVVYEGEGEDRTPVLLSNEPWDFAKNKVTEDITLVAKWSEVFRFSICLTETNAAGEKTEKELRSYTVEPGDTIVDKLYKVEGDTLVRRADYVGIKVTNYTILDFYLDESLTTVLDTAYAHPGRREVTETQIDPETNEETTVMVTTNTVKIYVQYLSGKYDLVSQKNVQTLTESSLWYVVEDVDFSGKTWDALGSFTGKIYGNGFTLKNITVTSTVMKPATGKAYKAHSIFGKMGGLIDNVTLENVTFEVKTSFGTNVPGEQRVNFIAYNFTENGKMQNVTLQDCRIVLGDYACYESQVGTNGGWWWDAPSATQLENVEFKQGETAVETIQIVTE